MPAIKEFTNPIEGVRPSDMAESAFKQTAYSLQRTGIQGENIIRQGTGELARGIGVAGAATREIGDVFEQHQAVQQHLQAVQQDTAGRLQDAENLPGIMAKSDDPVKALQDYYQNVVGPRGDKIASGLTNEKAQASYADHRASADESFQVHYLSQAMDVMGAKTIAQADQIHANNAALVDADPHQLSYVLDQERQTRKIALGNMSVGQQATAIEHGQQQDQQLALVAVQSAARTFFRNNPTATPDQFPMGDLGKDSTGNSVLGAQGIEHAKSVVSEMHAQIDHETRERSQDAIDQYTSSFLTADGRINAAAAVRAAGAARVDPNIRPQDRNKVAAFAGTAVRQQRMEDLGFAQMRATRDDPNAVLGILKGFADGTTTLDSIGADMKAGKITPARGVEFANQLGRADQFKQTQQDPRFKAAIATATSKLHITGGLWGNDPAGNEAAKQFNADMLQRLGGLDKASREQYLDPRSPAYIGSDDALKAYMPSDEQRSAASYGLLPSGGSTPAAPTPAAGTPPASNAKKAYDLFFGGK